MNQSFTQNGKSIKPIRLIYIWVIFYVLITVGEVEEVFSLPYYFNTYRILEILYLMAIISSELFLIIGFFNKSPRAWYFTITLLILASFKLLFEALIGQNYFESAFEDFFTTLIFTLPIGIYFIKNKTLYFKDASYKPAHKSYPNQAMRYDTNGHFYNQQQNRNSNNMAPNHTANYSTSVPLFNGVPYATNPSLRIKKYCKRCGKPLTDRDIGACSNCGKKIR